MGACAISEDGLAAHRPGCDGEIGVFGEEYGAAVRGWTEPRESCPNRATMFLFHLQQLCRFQKVGLQPIFP